MDGTYGIDDVTVSDGNVGVAVEGDKQGVGWERVSRVEGIADIAGSIDCCPAPKGGRRLCIVVQRKVFIVVVGQVGVGWRKRRLLHRTTKKDRQS